MRYQDCETEFVISYWALVLKDIPQTINDCICNTGSTVKQVEDNSAA